MKKRKNVKEYPRKYNEGIDNGYSGSFTYDNKAILNKNRRVKNVVNK